MSNDLRVLSAGELDIVSGGEHLMPVPGSVTPDTGPGSGVVWGAIGAVVSAVREVVTAVGKMV